MSPSLNDRVEAAAAEYLQAADRGAAPPRDEFLARFPEFANDLAEFLNDLEQFGVLRTPRNAVDADPALDATRTFNGASTLTSAIVPRTIPDYEILNEIARGGMGIVYKARQVSLNRLVALKVIRAGEFADSGEIKRFRSEAESAANFDHPHIVPIYEVGEHAGQQYYTMRLIEGGSLSERMAEFAVPEAKIRSDSRKRQLIAANLLTTVARAVHHAHQRSTLHRDLKPANILLDPDGTPHVTDFGLARRIGKDSTLTKTGAIIGTPSYMAPEQARGREDVTTEADVYGLGAVLYHLLTGRPPFQGEDVLDTIYQVREREPVRPRSLCSDVDRDLETICLKCLEKDPSKRYQSAAALADDLDRWANGEAILASRATSIERAVKWARRNPAGAGLVGLGALAAAAMIWVLVALSYNAELEERKRLVEVANVELEAQKQDADRLRALAEMESARATEQERLSHRRLYVTNMNQAQKAWEEKRFGAALALLDKLRPQRDGQVDIRGPEWYKLWRECGGSDFELRGHAAGATSAAFSPDGTVLATGDAKGDLRLWSIPKQQGIRSWIGHSDVIAALGFSPDGRYLASASHDRFVCIWELESGLRVSQFDRHADQVLCLAFDPVGSKIASGGRDGAVQVWHTNTGDLIESLPPSGEPVLSIGFGEGGKTVFAAAESGTARVLEIQPDRLTERASLAASAASPDLNPFLAARLIPVLLWNIPHVRERYLLNPLTKNSKRGSGWRVSAIAFGPKNDMCLVAKFFNTRDPKVAEPTVSTLELVKSDTREAIRQWNVDRDPVRHCCFSADGRFVAVGVVSSRVLVCSVANGSISKEFQEPGTMNGVCLSPNGEDLVTLGQDGVIRFRRLNEKPFLTGGRANVSFNRAGDKVVSYDAADVWNPRERIAVQPSLKTKDGYSRMAITPDGRFVTDGFQLLDLSLRQEQQLPNRGGGSPGVAFSPDSRILAVAGRDAKASRLYSLDPLGEIATLKNQPPASFGKNDPAQTNWSTCLAFSPDGRQLAIGYGNDYHGLVPGQVQIWDVQTRQMRRIFDRHTFCVWELAFSPDGKYLAGACGNYNGAPRIGEVKVWEAGTGREVYTFGGYPDCVYGVAFSADGQRIATASCQRSASGPGEVRVWDLLAGQQVFGWQSKSMVLGVAYSPDGRHLVCVGDGRAGQIWGPLDPNH